MAQAGKRPTRHEKSLLRSSGKDPADWLTIKKYPDYIIFRHRIRGDKQIRIEQ